MPGPAKYYGRLLVEAVRNWQIEEAVVTEAARRILRLLARWASSTARRRLPGALNTPEHQALAREVAEESITLLKNERGVLPLKPQADQIDRRDRPERGRGGRSAAAAAPIVEPPYRVSPLEGLKARLDGKVG